MKELRSKLSRAKLRITKIKDGEVILITDRKLVAQTIQEFYRKLYIQNNYIPQYPFPSKNITNVGHCK